MKWIALSLIVMTGCSSEPQTDVPALPQATDQTANELMAGAQAAAATAQQRSPKIDPVDPNPVPTTNNEVTR